MARTDVAAVELPSPMPDDELLALDEALDRLTVFDPRAADVVKLCFFVGMTQEEAARSWASHSEQPPAYGTLHARFCTTK